MRTKLSRLLNGNAINTKLEYFHLEILNWYKKKKIKIAPQPPAIIPEDCSAENNSVTVAWQAPNHSFVEGYVLELDDGSGGEFRVSTGI